MPGGFRFGGWAAYPEELLLRSEGETEKLEPKTMTVLELLATRAPNVVSINEMIDVAWAGTVVGDNAVYRSITLLRRALKDSARHPEYIESISRRGYRLKPAVEFFDDPGAGPKVRPSGQNPVVGHLRVAIGFEQPEGALESRLGLAIARYLAWTADAFKVRLSPEQDTNNDYLLRLELNSAGEDIELIWELFDCRDNTLVFSGNLAQPTPDFRARLPRLAETIADGVCDQIRRHKTQQLVQAALDQADMSYWELILTSDSFEGMDEDNIQLRKRRLQRAQSLFPDLAPAHAALSDLLSWEVLNGISTNPKESARIARQKAGIAIELDRDSPYVLSRCGTVFARLGDEHRGVELCRRSYELAPSASSKEALARSLCFAGKPEEAIPLLKEILETMPRGHVFRYGKLVVPLVQSGHLTEALDYSWRYISNYPGDYYAWVLHCNILLQLDDAAGALDAWKEAQRLAPGTSLDNIIAGTMRTYGRTEEQRHFLTSGLQQLRHLL